jgi:hypothetical protein
MDVSNQIYYFKIIPYAYSLSVITLSSYDVSGIIPNIVYNSIISNVSLLGN